MTPDDYEEKFENWKNYQKFLYNERMLGIDDIAVFVRVAELRNFSAAGRDLRLSAAVVSNRIGNLERRLGVQLLNRTTRRVALTPEGEIYYDHCVRILEEVERAEDAIVAQRAQPRGPLKVTAPTVFGRMHLVPLIPQFAADFPDIQVRLDLSDQLHDLIRESYDLAIRVADLKDSTAIVRKLADNRRFLCAAPSYLENHGTPKQPDDLLAHTCLLLRFPGSQQFRWVLNGKDGPVTINVSGAMDSDSGEAIRDWCLAGNGIALLSVYEAGHDIKDGRLKVVLPQHPPPGHGLYALYPHGRYVPPRVRAFIDFLAKAYGAKAPWLKGLPKGLKP